MAVSLTDALAGYENNTNSSDLIFAIRAGRHQTSNSPGACKVCNWISLQEEGADAEIISWVQDGLKRRDLYTILRSNGLPAKESAFYKHVRVCILGKES